MPDSPIRQLTIPQGAVWIERWRRRLNSELITLPGGFGGTGTLSFHGAVTGAVLSTSATASDILLALEALSGIGAGNVAVSGSTGGPWQVDWIGTLGAAMQALLVANPLTIAVEKVYRDLSGGYHAHLQVRTTYTSPDALIDALDTGGSPEIVIDTSTDTITLTVPPVVTAALDPADFPSTGASLAVYELQVTPPGGLAERWEHGTVLLAQGVVR